MRRPDSHVRVCRDCGEEYRPEIVRCADCGGELEDRHPGASPAPEPARDEPAAAELDGYRPLFVTARATDLVPMAERLRERQLEYRLAEQPGAQKGAPTRYAILVREADAPGALAAVTDLVAPHEDASSVHAVETRFDPEQGYVQCPACGTEQAKAATECPECGLGLGGEETAEEPHG